MATYIEREAALALVRPDDPTDVKAAVTIATAKKLVRKVLKDTPAADVVPTSQERIYKDLLDALFEDVRSLETTYVDACCMCTKGECDNCNLNIFTDALLKIIERATERKKRLID